MRYVGTICKCHFGVQARYRRPLLLQTHTQGGGGSRGSSKPPKISILDSFRGATALLVAGCNSLDAQPRYCSSFQLTHMSREDYAQSSIVMSSQQWRPKIRQELITVLTTSPAW